MDCISFDENRINLYDRTTPTRITGCLYATDGERIMKNWKYTLGFGMFGFLFVIAAFFVSQSINPESKMYLFITLLLFPVVSFLMGLEKYRLLILGSGGTDFYIIPTMVTIGVLGIFLQFAVIGHVVDHIVSFVKDPRKKKLTGPVITEPLNK